MSRYLLKAKLELTRRLQVWRYISSDGCGLCLKRKLSWVQFFWLQAVLYCWLGLVYSLDYSHQYCIVQRVWVKVQNRLMALDLVWHEEYLECAWCDCNRASFCVLVRVEPTLQNRTCLSVGICWRLWTCFGMKTVSSAAVVTAGSERSALLFIPKPT